jgi:hypothetical protein
MNLMDIDRVKIAQELVKLLVQGNFEADEQKLESGLRQQLPAEKQQTIWQSL